MQELLYARNGELSSRLQQLEQENLQLSQALASVRPHTITSHNCVLCIVQQWGTEIKTVCDCGVLW
jgi:hypothetical protein